MSIKNILYNNVYKILPSLFTTTAYYLYMHGAPRINTWCHNKTPVGPNIPPNPC